MGTAPRPDWIPRRRAGERRIMKLKTHLRAATLDHLMEIAEFWGLIPESEEDASEVEALASHLYPRLQTPSQFRDVFEKLDHDQRDVVYFLAIHGGEIPLDECRKRMGGDDPSRFDELVEGLNRKGFVWSEKISESILRVELIGIPEPFVRLVDLPPYWQGFLGGYLQRLGTNELLAIARRTLDERPNTRKKRTLVHYLRKRMLEPASLQEALGRRAPMQVEMFEQILQKNGVCSWKELIDAGVHKKFDHIRADQLRELVEQTGLVFVYKAAPSKYQNLLIVPRDLAWSIQNGCKRDKRSLREMSGGGAENKPSKGFETSFGPGQILDNSNNILGDLAIVCAYIQRHNVKMLNNGGVGRNDMKKIVPLVSSHKTVKYINFLARFAITKRLVIPVGEDWRSSSLLPQWIGRGQSCFRDLYEFAVFTNRWNEEYTEGDIEGIDSGRQYLINIPELRKLVLRMIEKVPSDNWIDFETFAESMLPQVAIEIPGRFDLMPTDKLNRHMYLIIESVLAETFHWLGIVSLGVSDLETAATLGSRPNEAIAPYDPTRPISPHLIGAGTANFSFKLTEFGRNLFTMPYIEVDKLFGKVDDPDLPYARRTGQFAVQPNLEIVTPPDLDLTRFFRLLQFTDVKNVDVMTTLTLTAETVHAGFAQSMTGSEIADFLREGSARDLPHTVTQLIQECQTRHGDVDMGQCGGYIVVNEAMRLAELRANKKIAPEIKDVIGENLILLSRTADFKKIAKELQRLGLMPQIDSDSIHVTREGLFQITLNPDELYNLMAVLKFCITISEEAGDPIFEDRVRPLFQRLMAKGQGDFNPRFYADAIAKTFHSNHEKLVKRQVNEETRKYRKQVTRLMSRTPRRESPGYRGENPASDPSDIQKLLKYAIENELTVKIKYTRSNGETIRSSIEPESFQGQKLYALDTEDDSHRVYALERIDRAVI